MPGKQARVLCPVCQEPIPPDETECENCGAFVIDEAVVRLSRAFGLDREKALRLFEAGFRHPKQLKDRDPDRVLEKGEVGLLFICTNCGSFVSTADTKCPRCAAEFETEAAEPTPPEEDILDLVLCPACGADNDPELAECEICGEVLRELKATRPPGPETPVAPAIVEPAKVEKALERVDAFLHESEPTTPEAPKPTPRQPTIPGVSRAAPISKPAPMTRATSFATPSKPPVPPPPPKREAAPAPPPPSPIRSEPRSAAPEPKTTRSSLPTPALEIRERPAPAPSREGPALTTPSTKRVRAEVPRRIPKSTARSGARSRSPDPPETAGGLILAAAASLLLAGALGQGLVSAGISVFLIGLGTVVVAEHLRSRSARPSVLDTSLLGTGAALGLSAPLLRESAVDPVAVVALSLAAAFPFAWATRRLIRDPRRILLAVGSAIPIIGEGLASAADPTYAMTLPWLVGIVAAMPWPTALAAMEILRRKSTSILRRQLIRAERDMRRENYERSLTEYDRAIAAVRKDVPGAEIPWYGKGASLVLLGRYDEALRAIDTALDINPHNEVAWLNKGNALTKLGRPVDALRCFNAAIKVNPAYEVAWNNKGNALARLGKFEEAVGCYERALEIDSGYRGAWVNKGFVLAKLGRYEEAASCADRALHLDPGRRADPI